MSRLAAALAAAYVADRLLKFAAVAHFFARERPPDPAEWPSVSLVQPLSVGASDLPAALEARSTLAYPARVQHLLVCDAGDEATLSVCQGWIARHPDRDAEIVLVGLPGGTASKTVKLQAGLARAECEVVCCVDDDILLRPNALYVMLPYLYTPGAGAVFGLACYTDWSNVPSALMSAFVNANALMSYIPATYLTEPFTITGHIFALRRQTLDAVSRFEGLEDNVGDDHRLAQRVRGRGLRAVQTPMVYDVANHFPTLRAYSAQMKRWFVMPRQALLPLLTPQERAITFLGSAANLLPSVLALQALLTRRSGAVRALLACLGVFSATYALGERLYLRRSTPLRRWPVVLLTALAAPAQVVGALFASNEVEWRGRRIVIEWGGRFRDAR